MTLRLLLIAVSSLMLIACAGSNNSPNGSTSAPTIAATGASTPVPTPDDSPHPAGSIGYAISWPQCGSAYPDVPFDFGIIGVSDGRAFTRNPCFADEYRWAERGRYHPSIYMNVNYRETADDFEDWWACHGNVSCRAYRYGWVAAHDAYEYAKSVEAVAPVWWLDVQIVSEWSADLTLNAYSVRGAADYLRSKHGVRIGMSSTSFQWETVAGSAQHFLPVWDASAADATEAAEFCTHGKDFGGGGTEQIAYVADGFEVVLACGSTRKSDTSD